MQNKLFKKKVLFYIDIAKMISNVKFLHCIFMAQTVGSVLL